MKLQSNSFNFFMPQELQTLEIEHNLKVSKIESEIEYLKKILGKK